MYEISHRPHATCEARSAGGICLPGRAEEQVDGDDQRERAEPAGQQVVEVTAGIGRPLDVRPVDAHELVRHVLQPLGERVAAGGIVRGRRDRQWPL